MINRTFLAGQLAGISCGLALSPLAQNDRLMLFALASVFFFASYLVPGAKPSSRRRK